MKPWPFLPLLLWSGAAEARDLEAVYYDFLLADYCDLTTPAVLAGYDAEVAALAARAGLDEAARERAASAASLAFEREWGNRGLGGSRPWCRREGADGAARLAAGGAAQP